jgi:hypothetical protein
MCDSSSNQSLVAQKTRRHIGSFIWHFGSLFLLAVAPFSGA